MVVALEGIEHLQGDRLGVGPSARIVCRLTTAGLRPRHFDRAARRLEQLDSGKPDRRPEEIHQAGYKQRYTHRRSAILLGSKTRATRDFEVVRRENQSAPDCY